MQIVLIALVTLSSVLTIVWLYLLFSSNDVDKIGMAYGVLVDNLFKIRDLCKKSDFNKVTLSQYNGIAKKVMNIFFGKDYKKDIEKLEKNSSLIQSGELNRSGFLKLPGYVIRRKFPSVSYISLYKNLNIKCMELYGQKYALHKANAIFAAMISYIILGTGVTITFGCLLTAFGFTQIGMSIIGIGTAINVLFSYSKYDEIRAKTTQRQTMIARQFPNVVSKLALLVCSGMIMDRAWRETASSREGELYEEMKTVAQELEQNIAPEVVYSSFIKRCNTKETSKLASAILQNLSKGNAEIGILLKDMAREAWQERRHLAKRDAEKANGKLLIPIMLLFVSVLIMIMVPLAMSMGIAF